jgi:MYXO-CTERM domain-containing protein
MKLRNVVAGAVMVQGLALLDLSAANANVILTYTGNDFNTFSPTLGSPGQPYTATDKVTASITLANPLGDNLNLKSEIPLAFSISDGQQTLANTTPGIFFRSLSFEFSTNASGTIIGWNVYVDLDATNLIQTTGQLDAGNLVNPAEASIRDDPGTWTETNVAVPAPPLSNLAALGVLGLAFFWRRRRQILDLVRYSTQP